MENKNNKEKIIEGVLEGNKQEEKNNNKKEKNEKKKNQSNFTGFRGSYRHCARSSSGGGIVFGLFIIFLGLFYLGKNLGWWSFSLDWTIIWPMIIIFVGLSIMGGKKIVNWIAGIILFFAIIVLFISMFSGQRYVSNKNISVNPANESANFFTDYSFKKYELVGDKESRFFSGYMTREEVEQDIAQTLDYIYQKADEDSGKLDIEVDIKRLIRQEVE